MRYCLNIVLFLSLLILVSNKSWSQCNTDVSICEPGEVVGPFQFVDKLPGEEPESSCLDWWVGEGAAFIILYITESGPLNILIQGDAEDTGGWLPTPACLDVAIYNIPDGVDPCEAIQSEANEIACNFIDPCEGCAEFGNTINGCAAQEDAPDVIAGDVVMIVVQDYSSAQTEFTMELAQPGQGAQTGPADATLTPVNPICEDAASIQLEAVNMGGDWTGPGVDADGVFNPGAAGIGTHTIDYSVGQPPCDDQDQMTIEVIDCTNPTCQIENIDLDVFDCDPADNSYEISGTVEFSLPPAGGTLTIESSCGGEVVFNAPFNSPLDFTIEDINSNGEVCTLTASFSDENCFASVNYDAPPPCVTDPCSVTINNATPTACDPANNSYSVSGEISFENPPTTGTLEVSGSCGGSETFDAPFNSPLNFTFNNLNSNGNQCTVTATFSDENCSADLMYTAPDPCAACISDAGTVTADINGQSENDFILCFGDEITISSNGDTILPPGPSPGISYAIYTCQPQTGNVNPADDPCYSGFVFPADPVTNVNDGGILEFLDNQGVNVTNNQIWIAPITMTDLDNLQYDPDCVNVGEHTAVTYLDTIEISTTITSATCDNADAELTANATGGAGGFTYSLDGQSFSPNNTFSNLAPGTVIVYARDSNGCVNSEQFTITGGSAVTINEIVSTPNSCSDDCDGSLQIMASVPQGVMEYSLDGNNFQQSNLFENLCPGGYTVYVRDEDGCLETTQIDVHFPEYPTATFSATPQITDIYDPHIEFTNTTEGDVSIQWVIGEFMTSDEDNIGYTFPAQAAEYTVCLIAINEFNCSDTTCQQVFVRDDIFIHVPNAFTPDGDGINDEFGPVIGGNSYSEFDFLIFNRWGQMIYQSAHSEARWDGTYNGKFVPEGVYIWRLRVRDAVTNEKYDMTGHVTLLR